MAAKTDKAETKAPAIAKDPTGVGPTSGVMATGAVGKAARAAAHTGSQTVQTAATLEERALKRD